MKVMDVRRFTSISSITFITFIMPIRTCLGCRRRKEQGELLRVHFDDQELSADKGSPRVGRGAYVCPDPDCIDKSLKGTRLAHTLRRPVTEAAKQALKAELLCQLR